MEPIIIDGKKISTEIKDECKERVALYKEKGIEICMAVIQVGSDPASSVYVNNKKKACEYIGIKSLSYHMEENTTEEELLDLIDKLNKDDNVRGILVQLPLPKTISEDKVLMAISPAKDVDGFHPMNVGNLCIGRKGFLSCTPAGVIELLKRYNIDIAGKECVVVGRSNIVGKPMSILLLRENGPLVQKIFKTEVNARTNKTARSPRATILTGTLDNSISTIADKASKAKLIRFLHKKEHTIYKIVNMIFILGSNL